MCREGERERGCENILQLISKDLPASKASIYSSPAKKEKKRGEKTNATSDQLHFS